MSRQPHRHHDSHRRRWVLAAAAVTLYGVAFAASLAALHARHDPHRSTIAPIGAALPDDMRRPRRATAYLVARATDCTANFEFLDLFDRPPIRDRLDLAGVIAIDDGPAADSLSRSLATHGHDLPVRPASPALRSALATVGQLSTPYLLVLDGDGALRFAIGAPGSVAQYLALGAALPLVGDADAPPHEP